jgi:hypothetical protein
LPEALLAILLDVLRVLSIPYLSAVLLALFCVRLSLCVADEQILLQSSQLHLMMCAWDQVHS